MSDRADIVTLMLTTARQIVASGEFARDARWYAEIASDVRDYDAAAALRAMVRAREAEALVMRGLMTDLASALARLPMDGGEAA